MRIFILIFSISILAFSCGLQLGYSGGQSEMKDKYRLLERDALDTVQLAKECQQLNQQIEKRCLGVMR